MEETTTLDAAAADEEVSAHRGIDPEGPAGYLAFRDALFRKKKKNGWRYAEAP